MIRIKFNVIKLVLNHIKKINMNTKKYLGNAIKLARKDAQVEQTLLTEYASISSWTLSRMKTVKQIQVLIS